MALEQDQTKVDKQHWKSRLQTTDTFNTIPISKQVALVEVMPEVVQRTNAYSLIKKFLPKKDQAWNLMGSSTVSVTQKALVRHAMLTVAAGAEDITNFYSFMCFKTNPHLTIMLGFYSI